MALLSRTLMTLAALALASLAACASEDVAPGGLDGPAAQPPPAAAMIYQPAPVVAPAAWTAPPPFEGLLAAPPSNAQPGECFAKVIVPRSADCATAASSAGGLGLEPSRTGSTRSKLVPLL